MYTKMAGSTLMHNAHLRFAIMHARYESKFAYCKERVTHRLFRVSVTLKNDGTFDGT